MSAEGKKLWRCATCGRVLLERDEGYARSRHRSLVREACGGAAEFVAEASWPAYLASLRRCPCGSRKRLRPLPPSAMRGQLDLHLEPVVLQ